MLWTVIGGIVFIIIGILIFKRPDWVWNLTEKWKSYRADGPSDFYLLSTRIMGGFFALFGAVVIILLFVLE